MKRNIVQVLGHDVRDDAGHREFELYALCNDGALFRGTVKRNGTIDWQDLQDVPQEPY